MALSLVAASRPAQAAFAPGPDSFGYTAVSVPFTFEDISGTGTQILANHDDNFMQIPIGFTFNFYGVCRTSGFVSTNALITFDSGTTQYINESFSGPVFSDLPMIAPLWDDWVTWASAADAIYYQTLGSPGARRLVVQWHVVQHFGGSPSTVTFQAVLFEGTNAIEFRYLDTSTGDGNAFGASATVGIRDRLGHTNGRWLQWSHNQPVIASMTAIRINAPLAAAPLTLTPTTDTNTVGETHTVTATLRDASGCPDSGVTIRFSVPTAPATGADPSSGSDVTDVNGEATFSYTASLPGTDTIHAYADFDNDQMQDPTEPFADATKIWVLPPSTAFCEVTITYGGRITAANDDRATFGGNAKVDSQGDPQGQEQYQDHGPAQPMNVHSINVLAVTCPTATEASIFGTATIDGAGSYNYRVDVEDHAEPGKGMDKYQIQLSNGYDSGDQLLEGGNVQIHTN